MKTLVYFVMAIVIFNGSSLGSGGNMGGATQDGSADHPWLIEDIADFDLFCGNSSYWVSGVHTKLMCDIDLTARTFSTAVIAPDTDLSNYDFDGVVFEGNFDGNEHFIRNVTIQVSYNYLNGKGYFGLFGMIGSLGSVSNLHIENIGISCEVQYSSTGGVCGVNQGHVVNCHCSANISSQSSDQGTDAGSASDTAGICGDNLGHIEDCSARGEIFALSDSTGYKTFPDDEPPFSAYAWSCAGGICGRNSGTVLSSFADCVISSNAYASYSAGVARAYSYAGGLSGDNAGHIEDSYAFGDVSGTADSGGGFEELEYLGGFCGQNEGTIDRCYAVCGTTNRYGFEGFCGYCWYTDRITNCFWNVDRDGIEASASGDNNLGARGKTTVEMRNITIYQNAGWDFTNETANGIDDTWQMCSVENIDYPRLAWETAPGDMGGGSGAENDPYLIENIADFKMFCYDSAFWASGTYTRLMADLDLSLANPNYSHSPIAPDFGGFSSPVYRGDFNGNGHVLRNLGITDVAHDNTGLFGYVSGRISNLGLIHVNIVGTNRVGSLCGTVTSDGIYNCYSTGMVSGTNYAGGLCGKTYRCDIVGSFSTCNVTGTDCLGGLCGEIEKGEVYKCHASGTIDGERFLGGFCGRFDESNITNCYSTGNLNGDHYLGGFCYGAIYCNITNCYSTGKVSGLSNKAGDVAGFCANIRVYTSYDGYNDTSVITDCFWDKESSGVRNSVGGVGKTTSEMKNAKTFIDAGWDFPGVWSMARNMYPVFSPRQPADLNYDGIVNLADLAILAKNWLVASI